VGSEMCIRDTINNMMQEVLDGFGFEQTENAIAALLQNK
jgi:hypothetical protein